ncbi:increased DNA methylation 3 [Euphorbia lathyris]|uniref:increased DNA methylation 3 n=1 Tax=Euphorbia lathyris TaxID=212925 RepID=UPI003313F43F
MDQQNIGSNLQVKPFMKYSGTAKESIIAPPFGLMDIGISADAYLFRVALPGIRKEECNIRCLILHDGTVCIRGKITPYAGGTVTGPMGAYQLRVQQLASPGPFTLSFKLPGPVDPRLFTRTFRGDGVLEGVVMKIKVPIVNLDGGSPPNAV